MFNSQGTRAGRLALFATLGFDEKFAVRCLMRNIDETSKMVVITAPPLDDYSRSKLETAWNSLRKVAGEYADVVIERYEVEDPIRFWLSVREIRNKIYEELGGHEGITLCLSGGLRALIAEVLVAAITLPSDASIEKVVVEIELENLAGVIRFNIAQVQRLMQLTGPEQRIIELLEDRGAARLGQIANLLNKPRSTVYRMLQRLEKLGLVSKEADGTYKPIS